VRTLRTGAERQRFGAGQRRGTVVVCGLPEVLSMTERPSVDVCSAVRAHRSPLRGVCIAPGKDQPSGFGAKRRWKRRHLEDCTAGRDLHGCDTPRVQHHESFAVSTPQHPGGLGQRGDDTVDRLSFATRIAILVGDVNVVTADEPDTKHDRFHVLHTTTPRRRSPGSRVSRGLPHRRLGALCAEKVRIPVGEERVVGKRLQPGDLLPAQRHGVTVSVGVFDPVGGPLGLLACAAASPGHELTPFGSHAVGHDPHDRA
jgi:hypothetical protein